MNYSQWQPTHKSIEKTKSYYDSNTKEYVEKTRDINMENIYDKFLKHIPIGGNILDAGCGSARDSLFFKNNGFKVNNIYSDTVKQPFKINSNKFIITFSKS